MANETVVGTKRLEIHVSQLKLGMYVAELDIPWVDSTFMFQGFEITSIEQIEELKEQCKHVFIVISEEHHYAPDVSDADQKPEKIEKKNIRKVDYENEVEIEAEFEIAQEGYKVTLTEIKSLLDTARMKETLNFSAIKDHVVECAESIARNPNALLWLTRIKHVDEYTAEHCVNVGVLAMSFGRFLGLPMKQLQLLGQCGVLHDIGKMQINQDILNKPGKLTDPEFKHVQNHPLFGHKMLSEDGSTPRVVKEAVFSHHERMDGNGYPRGVPAGELSLLTRITSIVDVYDALTSHRCYDDARPPALALKILYLAKGSHLDEDLVIKFIELIGIYPLGSIVELSSGQVAVVIQTSAEKKLRPKVAVVLDSNKNPMVQKIIDLGQQNGPDKLSVKAILPDKAYGIDLETTVTLCKPKE